MYYKAQVKLQKWKVYLYSLIRRIEIFHKINRGKINFKLRPGEWIIITSLIKRFGRGDVLSKLKAFIYYEYVKIVEENQSRCSNIEWIIAVKLSEIKKLYLEDLLMEIQTLRKFGKEVGLTFGEMRGLEEDEFIRLIISKIDSKKSYSSEFVEWYDEIPEDSEYLSASPENKEEVSENVDADDIIAALEDSDKMMEDLQGILEEFPDIFDVKVFKKIKDVTELQEAMIKVISGDNGDTTTTTKTEGKEMAEEISKEELVEAIKEITDLDELKEVVKEYTQFFDTKMLRGKIGLDTLKGKMMEALNVKETAASGTSEDELEAMVEELEAMDIKDVKEAAKELGIKVRILDKKDTLIEKIVEAMQAQNASEPTETEINQSMILDMVKAKDTEGLIKISEELGVKFGILDKRSPAKMGDKLIAAISETTPVAVKEEKVISKKEKGTIFMQIASMVESDKTDDEITTAMVPVFKEKGIDRLTAKGKIKTLIEVAKLS